MSRSTVPAGPGSVGAQKQHECLVSHREGQGPPHPHPSLTPSSLGPSSFRIGPSIPPLPPIAHTSPFPGWRREQGRMLCTPPASGQGWDPPTLDRPSLPDRWKGRENFSWDGVDAGSPPMGRRFGGSEGDPCLTAVAGGPAEGSHTQEGPTALREGPCPTWDRLWPLAVPVSATSSTSRWHLRSGWLR